MASAFRDRMLAATRVAYDQQRALQEEISQLYVQCAENLGRVADRYGDDSLTGRQAIVLRKSMQRYTRQMWSEVESKTRAGAYASAGIGIEAQASMLDDALHGIGITGKPSFMSVFGRTKDEAVASVLNGHIYAGKRAGLSKRIWNNEAMLNGQLESIISTAVAEGRSATQLARDLEAYVNPEAMMPDHWNDIYPMPFSYAVDYNAKRLAVTTLNHAYYQGTIMAARENPFAEFLHWELSSFHLIYDVCDTYMEHDEGLGLGNFSLDNAPLPHPFCRCTWYIDSSKSLDEIGQELGDWLAGAENPKLDKAFGEWRDGGDSSVLVSSSGAKKETGWRDRHAERYYEEVRKRKAGVDARKIAAYTEFTEEQIEDIRQHMFLRIQPLDHGRIYARFEPDYDQAEAWQRLTEGRGTELDVLMLRHEYLELTEMRLHGYNYDEAHEIANRQFDWWKAYKPTIPEEER